MRKKIFLIIIAVVVAYVGMQALSFAAIFSPFIRHVILQKQDSLKMSNGRFNVLILGIGGGSHDGPNLTDTIIYATVDTSKKKVTLISIPRDLWMPDLQEKINYAYAKGQENGQNKGLILAEAEVSHMLNQPVDYGFRIDFDGFVKAIDLIGGLVITVDNKLDDYAYPISGKEDDACGYTPQDIQSFTATVSSDLDSIQKFSCRFKHLHFNPGVTHMDGETALEYVRSRHGVGSEGTDFARSRRQQKVIEAIRSKVLSTSTLFDINKLIGLYDITKSSIDTDIPQTEFGAIFSLFQSAQGSN